ncbi:MAG TPA: hypothetical protein VG268_02075, partial [Streptosporangiaceae bacterium]|nr:hypothetical protein [Streptosporangiaceae bacterium]
MRGVRGFGDRSTITLPGGNSVFQQPDTPAVGAATQYPWRLSGTDEWQGSAPPSAATMPRRTSRRSPQWTRPRPTRRPASRACPILRTRCMPGASPTSPPTPACRPRTPTTSRP